MRGRSQSVVRGEQPAAIAAKDETAFVFADQPGQLGHEAGHMQIGEIVLPIDATKTGVFLISLLTPIGQRGLAAEVTRQIAPGGRFEALLTDGVRQ